MSINMSKSNQNLTAESARKILHYEPTTGLFYRLQSQGVVRRDAEAGSVKRDGYLHIHVHRIYYLAHRLGWLMFHESWPCGQIDHIDGNKLNNRIGNLREATAKQNSQNRGVVGIVPFKGVAIHKSGKFQAAVDRKYIGLFSTPEEAALAYDAAATAKFGEFARLNFPAVQP